MIHDIPLAEDGDSKSMQVWKFDDKEADDPFVFALGMRPAWGHTETVTHMSREEATQLRDALTALLGDR